MDDKVKNFTIIKDEAAMELGLVRAAVFSVVWRFSKLDDNVCRASYDTLSEKIGTNKATVGRHIKALVKDGYLKDLDTGKRNAVHRLVLTQKALHNLLQRATVEMQTVAESNATVAESNRSVAESHLKKQETIEETFQPDYLASVVEASKNGLQPEKSEPSDFDKYFGKYRDEILEVWQNATGGRLIPAVKDALIQFSRAEDFDIERFKKFFPQWLTSGFNSYNDVEKMIKDYRGIRTGKQADSKEPNRVTKNKDGSIYV